MSNMQAMINGMNAEGSRERGNSQMTLGELIDRLKEMDLDDMMIGLSHPHSYRGYYTDLCFEVASDKRAVGQVLKMAEGCMGEVFEGWKGGDFQMGRNTPIWIANEGSCGPRIMSVCDDGSLQLQNED